MCKRKETWLLHPTACDNCTYKPKMVGCGQRCYSGLTVSSKESRRFESRIRRLIWCQTATSHRPARHHTWPSKISHAYARIQVSGLWPLVTSHPTAVVWAMEDDLSNELVLQAWHENVRYSFNENVRSSTADALLFPLWTELFNLCILCRLT